VTRPPLRRPGVWVGLLVSVAAAAGVGVCLAHSLHGGALLLGLLVTGWVITCLVGLVWSRL